MESNKAKIYEWEDSKNTRFRVVADRRNGGPQLPLSHFAGEIIIFYSERES